MLDARSAVYRHCELSNCFSPVYYLLVFLCYIDFIVSNISVVLQQQAKRQGSPWRSPGARAPSPRASPRIARPPGFETHLLEPEDLAWESPTSAHHSSSAHPSGPDGTLISHQAAAKEAADPSSGPQSGDGSVLGSQQGSPDKVQGGSDRQGKGLFSYPLDFSGKAEALKSLTEKERKRSSRNRGSAKVSRSCNCLLAAFWWNGHYGAGNGVCCS